MGDRRPELDVWVVWKGASTAHRMVPGSGRTVCGKKFDRALTVPLSVNPLCGQCSGVYSRFDFVDCNDDGVPEDQL